VLVRAGEEGGGGCGEEKRMIEEERSSASSEDAFGNQLAEVGALAPSFGTCHLEKEAGR
jgi:hypothetical protein